MPTTEELSRSLLSASLFCSVRPFWINGIGESKSRAHYCGSSSSSTMINALSYSHHLFSFNYMGENLMTLLSFQLQTILRHFSVYIQQLNFKFYLPFKESFSSWYAPVLLIIKYNLLLRSRAGWNWKRHFRSHSRPAIVFRSLDSTLCV